MSKEGKPSVRLCETVTVSSKSLTINRTGTVKTASRGVNQCRSIGWTTYDYHVAAECGNKLDRSGFIIDHNTIDAAIQRVVRLSYIGSCEELVNKIGDVVADLLDRHGAEWFTIQVQVKPEHQSVAWMEGYRARSSYTECKEIPVVVANTNPVSTGFVYAGEEESDDE